MKGASPSYWRITHHMGEKPAKADLVIARIAARQHGVVSTQQLQAARMSRQAIYRRLGAGRLHRIHRGVYAVGHTRLSFEGRCMAAVLALGPNAVISHRSAAALWGLLPSATGFIEVSVPGDNGRERRPGIAIHRSHSLIAAVATRRNGIALTKPSEPSATSVATFPSRSFDGRSAGPSICASSTRLTSRARTSSREASSKNSCSDSAAATTCPCPR